MILNQLIMNGIIAGSLYALIATGFSYIYAANRFLHLAHGMVALSGAYLAYTLFHTVGLPFWLAATLAVLASGVLGLIVFCLVYQPLMKRKSSQAILLIAGLALMILLENLLLLIYGPDVRVFELFPVIQGVNIAGAFITPLQIIIVGVSSFLLMVLWLFVYHTPYGRLVRAVADNPELAATTGVPVRQMQRTGFFLGSCLAGVAGIFLGLEYQLEAHRGVIFGIEGFTASVVGGLQSIPGAVLGSYLLGLAENLGIWFLPSAYKSAIAYGLLLIFLLFRPQGILGKEKGIRQ